jgi:hypothetical protein
MAQVHVMPIRGERSAPTFDPSSPNDITRYFKQLETLFARCMVQDDNDKKQHATSYVSSEVADTWEALTEFTDQQASFKAFKDRLFEIYNQVSLRYIISDLDRIIGERQRLGVRSLQDLSEFHLRFNAISTYLIANDLLSSREQSQAYLRVFDESAQNQITMRLQIKLPNHHPSLPYPISEVYEAAKWVLQGVPGSLGLPMSAAPAPRPTAIANASNVSPGPGFIKTEQLGSFLNDFTKTIIDAINAGRPRPSGINPTGSMPPRSNKCMFDGCDRFIRDCAAVEEYIRIGKCRRNVEGKVVLSSGAFVPRDIPGEFLRDRIDEWHRRNPNQLATGILSSNTTLLHSIIPEQPRTIPTLPVFPESPQYQLSAQDRIAALESELFNLRVRHNKNFVPIIQTRKQRQVERERGKEKVVEEEDDEEDDGNRSVPPAKIIEVHEEEDTVR